MKFNSYKLTKILLDVALAMLNHNTLEFSKKRLETFFCKPHEEFNIFSMLI